MWHQRKFTRIDSRFKDESGRFHWDLLHMCKMCWLHKSLPLSRLDKLGNEKILERPGTHSILIATTTKQEQMPSSGHVCRKETLKFLISTRKFERRRAMARQRNIYVTSMKRRMVREQYGQMDRGSWSAMTIIIGRHDTW